MYGSEPELLAMLMNLCLNAVEALPDGSGIITIETSLIGIDDESALVERCRVTAERYIRIEIHDTGGGIPPGTLKHIFEPFFSSKSSAEDKTRGLGLYRVQQCTVAHGGAIGVTSMSGKGTTFTVLLPVAVRGALAETKDTTCGKAMALMQKIVVIDENDQRSKQIASIFSHIGIEVVRYPDPETAISWVREHRGQVSLAIIDHHHSYGSGMKCVNTLKSIDDTMRFILYMHNGTTAVIKNDRSTVTLCTPFKKQELIDAIDRVLQVRESTG